ncbi:6-phosphofructokinase [candidate division KSB3 bacterium]|uniref:Pyrophosphate--fructose 6-phosphate 1-phosphotransferase n=1 Tax=candidate division KSB3 bacterium TaxID=2044937 RepID=A0A2G6KDS1_9BACT|nr:MAG: 6-phosphofructokinase [candidate division KSB3 bacterium]
MDKTIGILTGDGDCPGLNAVIRGLTRKSLTLGNTVIGIRKSWKGILEKDTWALDINSVSDIISKGGTILGSSRTNPFKYEGGPEKVIAHLQDLGIDILVAVGSIDTLMVSEKLYERGCPVIGIPKTIDNDLPLTDRTFGFDTAISTVTEAIDRIHSTAESHDRVVIMEVMGRYTGWIATYSGIAGGADCILIPEKTFSVEDVCKLIRRRHQRGKDFSIIVVAEGARPKELNRFVVKTEKVDEFGHKQLGGIGNLIAQEIEKLTGFETRVTMLGPIQRGGSPTPFDRVLATRFGVKAAEMAEVGSFGKMVSLQGNDIVEVKLAELIDKVKPVDSDLYEIAEVFFG